MDMELSPQAQGPRDVTNSISSAQLRAASPAFPVAGLEKAYVSLAQGTSTHPVSTRVAHTEIRAPRSAAVWLAAAPSGNSPNVHQLKSDKQQGTQPHEEASASHKREGKTCRPTGEP